MYIIKLWIYHVSKMIQITKFTILDLLCSDIQQNILGSHKLIMMAPTSTHHNHIGFLLTANS